MKNNKITLKILILMLAIFIYPAYIMYDVFGTYDYILHEEPTSVGVIFPILWLIVGAIIFKCHISNYNNDELDNSLKFVDSSGNNIDNDVLPKCVTRFYTILDEFDLKYPFLAKIVYIFLLLLIIFVLFIVLFF